MKTWGLLMKNKLALVTDFDGTISDEDFFWFVADKYFDDKALAPWQQYLAGKISHFDALNEMFAQIHLPEKDFLEFIDGIKYDAKFLPTVELCHQLDIPVCICSAGCDYYINHLIGNIISKYKIKLVTNLGVYNPETGLKMISPPEKSPLYNKEVGISKAGVVGLYHAKGYKVIFAGDGPPDFSPAQLADVVFAKKILLKRCQEANMKTQPFNDFCDVYNYILEQ